MNRTHLQRCRHICGNVVIADDADNGARYCVVNETSWRRDDREAYTRGCVFPLNKQKTRIADEGTDKTLVDILAASFVKRRAGVVNDTTTETLEYTRTSCGHRQWFVNTHSHTHVSLASCVK